MRFCLAVPTYWTHPSSLGAEEVIYDHPTPLDADGDLPRFLDSTRQFLSTEVRVVVVAAATARSLTSAVESRLQHLLAQQPSPQPLLFSYSHLEKLQTFCRRAGHEDFGGLLSLSGYAAIRNLTLVAANLLNADVLVSLDDDEIITDPDFLTRLAEDVALLAAEQELFGLAGLYESPQGEILVPEPTGAWVKFWPKIRWMNEAFAALAAPGPRLRPTPLALGGNMALGAALFRSVPFDPALTRGEDIDYVLNARMFKVPFYLDPDLRVVHDPPAKPHPLWRRLRQDLQRFWYTRQKLLSQEPSPALTEVREEELQPYPGNFLTADLKIRAYQAHTVLALEYLEAEQIEDARQTLHNLTVLTDPEPIPGVMGTYLALVERWRRLQAWLAQPPIRTAVVEALWG